MKGESTMDKQTAELGAKILQNLPEINSEMMQEWIEHPYSLQEALRKALCRFKTLMTVKLGTGLKTADEFRHAFEKDGRRISDWASDILNKITVATKETELELVITSVAELGFKKVAKYSDICDRIKELGYDLCPAEVGPQLRLQYKNQPNGEWLRVAMEPIEDSDGDLRVFHVKRDDDDLWLSTHYGNPDRVWYPEDVFVFAVRK